MASRYKDQPLECDICHQGHKAKVCPLKGKCLRCHLAGYFVTECPNPSEVSAPAAASASAAPSSVGPVVGDTSPVDEVASPPSGVVLIPYDGVDDASASAAPLPASDAIASASVPVSGVDLRDNQLDELSSDSQPASQSVLAGLNVVTPSGDVLACSTEGPS